MGWRRIQDESNFDGRDSLTVGGLVYLLHVAVSTVGVFLCSMVVGAVLEQTSTSRLGDLIFTRPPYIGVAVLGLLIGFLMNRRLHSVSAAWVWIFPFFVFLTEILPELRMGDFSGVINYLLARGCGGCMDQLLIISPFVGSAAYSLGAWAALREVSAGPSLHVRG